VSVVLPEGENIIFDITYLDDFVSFGWTGFATFDKIHNGGWATKERLFCVRPSYDLNSEQFMVSYLAHEARHFLDYKQFPCLQQADLEYRAKLTELAMADETSMDLTGAFKKNALNDPKSPHALAAYHISRRLELEIAAIHGEPGDRAKRVALRAAATRLLAESSAMLRAKGADITQGILGQ
jgi:hypothetical protein